MVTFSHSDWLNYEAKQAKSNPSPSNAASRETGKGGLHEQIMDYCNAQWPRWRYIHSRTDQKSTIGVGVSDFTIFMPHAKVLSIEVKTRTGKLTTEQMAWAKEMELLGHTVHVVRSFSEFSDLCRSNVK